MGGMSVEPHAISELLLQRLPEAVAQRAHAIHRREIARKLAGLAEAGGEQHALGTRAAAKLVPGTMQQRFDRHAIARSRNRHGSMMAGWLDARRDDVIAAVAVRKEHALEGEVVGLAAAARENDLVASAAEQRRHLAARRLEGDLCRGCRPMPARRIAV